MPSTRPAGAQSAASRDSLARRRQAASTRRSVGEMDDSTKPDTTSSSRPEADAKANDLALGVVFAGLGVTLVSTVDTPWAGVPLLVVGVVFLVKALRGMRLHRDEPERAPDA